MSEILNKLEDYHVVWTTPGNTDRSSMPLGNGEVGISLWVEEDGDMQFYIARSDALTELDRNVKLGKVRVRFSNDPFRKGNRFRQELKLRDGLVEIKAGERAEELQLRIFVDSGSPSVNVIGQSAAPVCIQVLYENWRIGSRLSGSDSPLGIDPPADVPESPDYVRTEEEGILFFHRNGETCLPLHASQQGLTGNQEAIPDTISNRVFGGYMTLTDGKPVDIAQLESSAPVHTFEIKISTDSSQIADLDSWVRTLIRRHGDLAIAKEAERRTSKWWNRYWTESWIYVDGDGPVDGHIDPSLYELPREKFDKEERAGISRITQAYILTKWMTRCAALGQFPIYFNGSLFNVMPGENEHYSIFHFGTNFSSLPAGPPDLEINPDERPWGTGQLWQNLRLPYLSMLSRKEYDSIRVLFRYFRRFWELNRIRAKLYYGAEGQHNTEMTLSFGLQPGNIYGWERGSLPPGYAVNRWGGAIDISPGLELVRLMLEYCDYTSDYVFLQDELLPYAKDLMRYIETRFSERANGKILLTPLQSVETYFDTTDPLPVVAGMHAVLDGILGLPESEVNDREYFAEMKRRTPDIPLENTRGATVLAPARHYKPERQNVELPEMYAVFPFRLYGIGKPDVDMAKDTFRTALEVSGSNQPYVLGKPLPNASYSGWQSQGMVAALLGMTEMAREILQNNCGLTNPGFRFPAMWGPIYDAVPDIDHGSNILNTLQLMLFQAEGSLIRLLPAWPKEWNVWFKLHAPGNTIVECQYRDGEIVQFIVDPPERAEHVVWFQRIKK